MGFFDYLRMVIGWWSSVPSSNDVTPVSSAFGTLSDRQSTNGHTAFLGDGMTSLTAQPTLYKTPGDALPAAISFVAELTAGDLLTGTPTVTVSPAGPAVSSAIVNTAGLWIEIEGNKHYAKAGQAVLCNIAGGTAGQTYTLKVSVSTVGTPNRFVNRPVTLVVSND